MTKFKNKKAILLGLVTCILAMFCFFGGFIPKNMTYAGAEETTIHKLFSGNSSDVIMSKPKNLADPAAAYGVDALPSYMYGTVGVSGYMEFKAYTGYQYGAWNFTFSNPVKKASMVKKMWITMLINTDSGSNNIIYINEDGNGSVPYFRLYPVNEEGMVITSRYFAFTDKNSIHGEQFTMELSPEDIALLTNDNDEIETLQWAFYHTKTASGNGVASFRVIDISYEYFSQSDAHSVIYYVNDAPVYSESTYYYATPPALTKSGYSAVWLTEDGEVYDFSRPILEDTKLKLSWKGNTYTIKFQSNGGTAVSSMTAVAGESVVLPEAPTRKGYEFVGWYVDSILATPFVAESSVTQNTMLYAKWRLLESDAQASNKNTTSCSSFVNSTAFVLISMIAGLSILLKKEGMNK